MLNAHDMCANQITQTPISGAVVKTVEANRTTRKSTNLSRSAEAGIADAVIRNQRERWLKGNAAALASSNAYIEANGLPLARHRQF